VTGKLLLYSSPQQRQQDRDKKMNILAAPAIILTAAVTLLAVLIAIGFAILVSRVRRAVGIQPPAMGGDPRLERALRVQGNTVEGFIAFVPALWLAALYFQGWVPPIIGLVWCLGRVLFAVGYMSSAQKRHIGFAISILSVLALVILAAIGLVGAWTAANAV
jgi:glutathione S-transferase